MVGFFQDKKNIHIKIFGNNHQRCRDSRGETWVLLKLHPYGLCTDCTTNRILLRFYYVRWELSMCSFVNFLILQLVTFSKLFFLYNIMIIKFIIFSVWNVGLDWNFENLEAWNLKLLTWNLWDEEKKLNKYVLEFKGLFLNLKKSGAWKSVVKRDKKFSRSTCV